MTDRWRKPIKILAVEPDPNSFIRWNEGAQWSQGVRWVTDEEGRQRIRDGQVCLMCVAPQPPPAPNPIPEQCVECGYPMREYQIKHFDELEYEPEGVKLGGSTTITDELARLDLFAEQRVWKPGSQIILPRGVADPED